MSRRQKELSKSRLPASVSDNPGKTDGKNDEGVLGRLFDSIEPTQEIVIMNTEKGFVPETVRLKKGQNYKIHVVNVNDKEKNTSFILDAFSEHHATYYGQEKAFGLAPKTEGIFSFQCPETAKQGKIIIIPEAEAGAGRKPASAN